jgi:hypothetical protein
MQDLVAQGLFLISEIGVIVVMLIIILRERRKRKEKENNHKPELRNRPMPHSQTTLYLE